MVAGLAFIATAVATVFAQATAVRWSRSKAPYQGAWTVALALFALASAAFATGSSTGWDEGTFRIFYLLGAIVNVPWLALGTVYLLWGRRIGNPARAGLVFFTGLATGVMLSTPMHGTIDPNQLPVGKDHFDALPRALAGIGSGVGAVVLIGGAIYSAIRFSRLRTPGSGRLALGNVLIALGTLVLSSGGLIQGTVGQDEAFAISLAAGISVIYLGFVVTSGRRSKVVEPAPASSDSDADSDSDKSSRRSNLPVNERGSVDTTSTRVGSL